MKKIIQRFAIYVALPIKTDGAFFAFCISSLAWNLFVWWAIMMNFIFTGAWFIGAILSWVFQCAIVLYGLHLRSRRGDEDAYRVD